MTDHRRNLSRVLFPPSSSTSAIWLSSNVSCPPSLPSSLLPLKQCFWKGAQIQGMTPPFWVASVWFPASSFRRGTKKELSCLPYFSLVFLLTRTFNRPSALSSQSPSRRSRPGAARSAARCGGSWAPSCPRSQCPVHGNTLHPNLTSSVLTGQKKLNSNLSFATQMVQTHRV